MISRVLVLLVFFVQACVYSGPFALYEPKEIGLFQNIKTFNPKTKIFLVAAGNDAAVYANEVIQQKRYWIKQGVPESEISCYYVMPDKQSYDLNSIRFKRIASDLSHCYYVSSSLLEEHLKLASLAKNDYIYLYITGHGQAPQKEACTGLRNYVLAIPADEKSTLSKEAYKAEVCKTERPLPAFSPSFLEHLLSLYPKSSHKYVVLQACHSGGFVFDPEHNKVPLASIENLDILTASHANRTSFGCSPGESMTYFGSEYFAVLERSKAKNPTKIDWRKLSDDVCTKIEELELAKRFSEEDRSYPQYMTTRK